MNVYEKLQQARIQLQKKQLKKSGKNTFAKYEYYELQDILPTINELLLENKLFSQITFNSELATLKVVNIEKPEEVIEFTSPMAEAALKGCHPIQNIGAVETYQRRYLYMTALEIVEHDALDSVQGKEDNKGSNKPAGGISEAQIKRLYAIARKKGVTAEQVKVKAKKEHKKEIKDLSKNEYDAIVSALEKLEDKK